MPQKGSPFADCRLACRTMAEWIDTVATGLFRYVVMWVLLGTGVFLTLRFGVVQLRRLPEAFRTVNH